MSEINCTNCEAACCRGNMIISLTLEELSFMLRGGNKLMTVAQPLDFDREEVSYPIAWETDPDSGLTTWLAEKGNEFEPLAAGLGRYVLRNDCAYLTEGDDRWLSCSVYDERPKVCQDFEMGGNKCRSMRIRQGIDVPVELTPKPKTIYTD